MSHTIDACKAAGAKLVFFDNVYMYGKVDGLMTEETPLHPSSRKGQVRAEIARMLMDEINSGGLKAMIARSADFYGPGTKVNSVTGQLVFERMKKKNKAQCLCDGGLPHSYTYTPDAAPLFFISQAGIRHMGRSGICPQPRRRRRQKSSLRRFHVICRRRPECRSYPPG